MHWSDEQLNMIDTYQSLEDIPENEREYICFACKVSIAHEHLVDGCCPVCHTKDSLHQRCPLDTDIDCGKVHATGFETCPICGEIICPECGNHQVDAYARITGYLSNLKEWNQGKVSELADRHRYNIA